MVDPGETRNRSAGRRAGRRVMLGGHALPLARAISPCGAEFWTAFAVFCGRSCDGLSPFFWFPRKSPLVQIVLLAEWSWPILRRNSPPGAPAGSIAERPAGVQGGRQPGAVPPPRGCRRAHVLNCWVCSNQTLLGSPGESARATRWDRKACERNSSNRPRDCGG